MYKLCKTEQSAQRQRQLEDGLLEAMQTQRFEDISISDLCDQMGVPRKSFYRYFSSKDGALHALIDHRFLEYEIHSNISSKDKGADLLQLIWFFEYWHSQKKLLDALVRSGLSSVLVERALKFFEESGALEFQTRRVPKNFLTVANTFVICGLISLVLQWHRSGFRESPGTMAEMTQILLTRPIVPEWN